MTVSSTTRKAGPYACNGATTVFAFAFKVFASTDLQIVLTDADGVESVLVISTGYSVSLNADQNASPGGTITTVATYATGNTITIASEVPALQSTDLTNFGGFRADTVEDMADRAVILSQQQEEHNNRGIRVPVSDPDALVDLPGYAQRASMYLGFDGDGQPIAIAAEAGAAVVTAFAETLLDDADAATARATLNAGGKMVAGRVENFSLDFSFAGGAMTARVRQSTVVNDPTSASPVRAVFRSYPLTSGVLVERSHTSALSLAISSTSTLGRSLASTKGYLFWYLIDYNGAIELAVSGKFHGWTGTISTTAEGGAGAADSSTAMYSGTARSNVAFVCAAMTIDTQATAGTWATAPSDIRIAPFTIPDCAFRAHRNGSNQTGVGDAAWTKWNGTTEDYDINGDYDSATNYRFTAPMPGQYQFSGKVQRVNPTDATAQSVSFYVNGAIKSRAEHRMAYTGASLEGLYFTDVLNLNTHDYVEMYIYHSRGTGEDFEGAADKMSFTGIRIGTGAA